MRISLPVPLTITGIFKALQRALLSHSKHNKFFHAAAHYRLSKMEAYWILKHRLS